ncbi:MAG: hypothetical protein FD170_2033 [Bacteroidetes bacterium]|nr:MAG: hypothetical protein FD170_2033 [Bacteroidota bacterium]
MNQSLKIILSGIIAMISVNVSGQVKEKWNHNIGINLLQIPATTIDMTYELSFKPSYTLIINPGYTMNYANSFDFIGNVLSPHYDCGNNGYSMKKQSGGYLKLGMKYNFRKSAEKKSYFYIGALITNSMIYEKAEYTDFEIPDSQVEKLNHQIFIIGLTGTAGYNFRISDQLSTDFGVQISMPSKSFHDLYGYTKFIPGMGYMETCGNGMIFPMMVLNLKYKLR